MYRRHWSVRLASSLQSSYLIHTVLPSVATALAFGLIFIVAPLLYLGNTDSSGLAASVSAPASISSFHTTHPDLNDEPAPGSIASEVGLDSTGGGL